MGNRRESTGHPLARANRRITVSHMKTETRTEAQRILDAACTPRDRSEETLGIDGDVIVLRILMSNASQAAMDLATQMAVKACGPGFTGLGRYRA